MNWLSKGYKVTTFEPLRTNVNLCVHSICENGFEDNVTIFNIGLGEEVKMCEVWSDFNNGDGWTVCDGKGNSEVIYF